MTAILRKLVLAEFKISSVFHMFNISQRLWNAGGLVVRVPGYRSRGPGSIPGATRFSEK
jgi:hypothetical protein